jgi:nitrate reductase gamma subunit
MAWISFIAFILGLCYQTYRFFSYTKKNPHVIYNPRPRKKITGDSFQAFFKKTRLSVVGVNPVMVIVTSIFHICLVITPLFLLAHNILLKNAIGVSLFSLSESFVDKLTLVFLACGLFFLLRRIIIPKVRAITDWNDYLMLFLATAPFISGYLAYHQIFSDHYRLIISLHILAGELMLVAVPFTKFVHMVFFFVFRFVIESEYSLGKGNRTW